MSTVNYREPLYLLFWVVIANYLAQIPYFLHQYYSPHHLFPDITGSLLLFTTLVWFVLGFRLLIKGSKFGWWLVLSYLTVVFLFYIQTQITQFISKHQILLYVYHPSNPLLFVVFGVGYINCVFSACYIVYLITQQKSLVNAPSLK